MTFGPGRRCAARRLPSSGAAAFSVLRNVDPWRLRNFDVLISRSTI
jgi:hypothetical protein